MKLSTIIIVVVLVILLVGLQTKSQTCSRSQPKKLVPKSMDPIVTAERESKIIDNRGPDVKELPSFPIPETTTHLLPLSPDVVEDLSIITQGAVLPAKPTLSEIRSGVVKDESHFPKYYRKDTMSGNTVGTTELAFSGHIDEEAIAWSDENVSQYPTYYKSDFKGGLTNVGAFFDQNNQYTDITGPRTDAQVGDVCYVSKEGEKVCLENDKLQNIPPSLVSDVNQCSFLNSIGLLQYSNRIDASQERVSNGGFLYDNVRGSKKNNETYSEPLFGQVTQCQI